MRKAVVDLNLDVTVEHAKNVNQIIEPGVMSNPGLVINVKLVSTGRCLTVSQVKELIIKEIR